MSQAGLCDQVTPSWLHTANPPQRHFWVTNRHLFSYIKFYCRCDNALSP